MQVSDESTAAAPRDADRFFGVDSPLGTLYVAFGERGVKYATADPASGEEFVRHYGETFGRLAVPAEGREAEDLGERVSAAIAGEEVEIPLDLADRTPFQRRVVEVVCGIPYGEARSYSWVAVEAGAPRASRAVGTVMANNPLSLIVPCHRVIRNDGKPGSYGSDPARKVRLLELEGVPVEEVARAPYLATTATGVVCHATCRIARQTGIGDRRSFRSVAAAFEAGFVSCEVCRPVAAT